jgi:hypothetical protein
MKGRNKMQFIKYVKKYGPVYVIRDAIHELKAKALFNAFVIATTQRLSDVDYNALIKEIINIFEDEQTEGEETQ